MVDMDAQNMYPPGGSDPMEQDVEEDPEQADHRAENDDGSRPNERRRHHDEDEDEDEEDEDEDEEEEDGASKGKKRAKVSRFTRLTFTELLPNCNRA